MNTAVRTASGFDFSVGAIYLRKPTDLERVGRRGRIDLGVVACVSFHATRACAWGRNGCYVLGARDDGTRSEAGRYARLSGASALRRFALPDDPAVAPGELNPSGHLPITFYRATSDLPPFTDYSMNNRTYRYFAGEPLYAFGHGLTYE